MLSMFRSLLGGVTGQDLETIKAITRDAYPAVAQVGTDVAAEWLTNPSLLVVDVRSREEFAVSHIRGAVNLQTTGQIAAAVKERKPVKTILYCSVGFRSSRLAHLLARQGWHGIFNLEGSIFQWANEGRPVYRGDIPVRRVHPYGKRWAGLLKDGHASDC
jgi:rhodanese-related sulfurtransferase